MTVFGPENISLRTDDYRYIRYEDGSEEFYDHKIDPYEWHNLAKDQKERSMIESKIRNLQQFIPVNPAPLAQESSFGMSPYFRDRMEVWRDGN